MSRYYEVTVDEKGWWLVRVTQFLQSKARTQPPILTKSRAVPAFSSGSVTVSFIGWSSWNCSIDLRDDWSHFPGLVGVERKGKPWYQISL